MYSAHADISRLQPVPAHLFGTRRAIFHLLKNQTFRVGEDSVFQPAPRPAAPSPAAIWHELLLRDEFRI